MYKNKYKISFEVSGGINNPILPKWFQCHISGILYEKYCYGNTQVVDH